MVSWSDRGRARAGTGCYLELLMSPSASLPSSLLRKLASVRRRRRALALAQAACWTAFGLALLAGALSFSAAVPAASWVRVLARLWVLAWIAVPIVVLVVPPWRRTASLSSLARAVDDRVPGTADGLLTAVDLAQAIDTGGIAEPETRRLADLHLGRADAAAELVKPAQLLPLSGLHWTTLLGPITALIVAAAWVMVPGRFDVGWQGVFGPVPGQEEPEVAGAEEEPVSLALRNVSIRLVPPAYAKRTEVVLDGTTGDIVALPGTQVFLSADASGSGKSVQVELEGSEDPIPGMLSGKHAEVSFTTTNFTWYRVVMPRGLGRDPLQTRRFKIEVLPDRSPELEVNAPPGPITLAASDSIPLNVRASDDFALSRLEQVVFDGPKEIWRQSIAEVDGLGSHDGLVRWSPESLQGKGGELQFVVEAWDNDTVNGPKVTRSRALEIYVPTAQDQHRKALQLKEALHAAAVDLLADVLVANAVPEKRTPTLRAQTLDIHDSQARLADAFFRTAGTLFEAMIRDELETGNSYAGIVQLVENLDTRWSAVVELVENQIRTIDRPAVHPVILRDLVTLRVPVIEELEQIVLDLSAFIDLHRGDAMRGDLAALGAQLGDMQDLLRRAADGEPISEEMEAAMEALKQRMAELAKKLAERTPGPDDGFTNSMPGEMSKSALEEAQELMRQGRYEEAMEKLRQADEALAQMEQSIAQESDQMAGAQAAESMQQALSEAIAEAKKLEAQQEEVLKATEDLADKYSDPESQEEMEEIARDVASLKEQVEELREGGGDPFAPTTSERARVRAASFEASGIESALAEGMADEAAAYAREAQDDLKQAAAAASSGERAKAERAAGKLAGSIAQRLEEMEAARRRGQGQAQRAGQPTAERQGGVANGVGQLKQAMEEMGGSAFNPAQGRESLDNAEQLMRRAQGQLGQGDPTRAGSAGKDGLNQLRQFRQGLESAQQAMQQGGPPRPGGQGESTAGQGRPRRDSEGQDLNNPEDSGRVEVSDPDEFVGPEAYRALLQEGAQGDAPERYKPLNGTYYEELVR